MRGGALNVNCGGVQKNLMAAEKLAKAKFCVNKVIFSLCKPFISLIIF